MKFPQIKSSRIVYEGNAFKVREDQLLFNAKTVNRQVVMHPGAVVILPRTSDGKLLLIKQYRHAIERNIYEFPAGTLEKRELPIDCAKRELIEETNHAAEKWVELGILYPAPGFCDELQHLYFADNLSVQAGSPDEDEIIEVNALAPQSIQKMISDGEICDAKSIAVFFRAQAKGLV